MSESALQELAALFDITTECTQTDVKYPCSEDDYIVAILQATGLPITDAGEANQFLQQHYKERWEQLLDSVKVVSDQDMPVSLFVRLNELDDRLYQWELTEESGTKHHGSFAVVDLAPVSSLHINNHDYTLYRLDLEVSLTTGYHQLVINTGNNQEDGPVASLLLIVAPEQCYIPPGIVGDNRVWGMSTHLHAIRSKNNWGIGDFTDLQQLLAMSAAQGAATVHTAPLNSLSSVERQNPYSPSCRSRLNILHIDIEKIKDFSESDEAKNYVNDARFQARLANLRKREQVDYNGVYKIKNELFKKLWKHFSVNHLNPETARGRAFRHFQQGGGETLRYYAIFSAIEEKYTTEDLSEPGWHNWPAELSDPFSLKIAEFEEQHKSEIEFYQYIQWQAEIQWGAIGRRSMELGLKVGLLVELPYSPGLRSFESWYYGGLLLSGTLGEQKHTDATVIDSTEGLPLLSPLGLKRNRYQPFIEALRHTMQHAGALIMRSFVNYFKVPFSVATHGRHLRSYVMYPFADLLGILALESQRNRCLVIADHIDLLPEEWQLEIRHRNIFISHVLFQSWDKQNRWLEMEDYPAHSVVGSTAPFLVSLKGLWQGRDISLKIEENIFHDDAEKEKAILSRASGRAHFLIDLDRQGLLPTGTSLDPAAVAEIDTLLFNACQILLARGPSKILLVSLNDLQGLEVQAEPPVMSRQDFWHTRYAVELENLWASQEVESIFHSLRRERGIGVVHPSVLAPDRSKRLGLQMPTAFYRLQLNVNFTFEMAAEIIPYLKRIGISHCYVSPFLKARPGSPHGYDIIDHCSLNPDIGSREDFEKFMAALQQHQMALLLDIVPNHMGIGSDNQWWMDVLENGETSQYAHFFDINWQPHQSDLAGRVILPVLGDHYGKILESSQLTLLFHEDSGNFSIRYFEHHFPVDPGSYTEILNHDLQRLSDRLGKQHNGYLELQNLISAFENLPGRQELSTERIQIRHRDKEVSKRILARLCREIPEVKQFIEENVILFNGESGNPDSFDLLHDVLEKQAYRLAYWRVAADEINYRRFFDINDLAGLRMEEVEVFRKTHQLILDLIATGKVDGLRVDHPDGLYDPYGYFCRLDAAVAGESDETLSTTQQGSNKSNDVSLYVVVEKILADFEHLPQKWPVCGTTGYDFSNHLNGLLLDSSVEKQMTSLYHRFIGARLNFDELLYTSKKLIIDSAMAGELNVLATLLFRLARADRSSRDFTLNRLRQALIEIVACFPVYRTYIVSDKITKEDAQFIEWAVARAKTHQQLHDVSVFDFIKSVLLLERTDNEENLTRHIDFVLKFQQYTGPLMAKGLEDTSFYIYNRLLSLNEVGGEPKRFGTSIAAFHCTNQERLQHWPHAMLNSSTHDSKRSEDVRARINVLTEMVPKWQQQVYLWSRQNRRLKSQLEDLLAPSRNDEYAFYQNLLGAWPLEPLDEQGHQQFVERMKGAMLKSCRESKVHTSWISPNEPYEKATTGFVERALSAKGSTFLTNFLLFQEEISWFGMLNSLSQVFLKLVCPGIPDIYQGNEIWRFCLVDPDNRRPVDYQKRMTLLFSMLATIENKSASVEEHQQELLANLTDGRAKMYVIIRALALRNTWPDVFEKGCYFPLEVTGSKQRHICAFSRRNDDRIAIAVAPRLYFTLMEGKRDLPLGERVWEDTKIKLPANMNSQKVQNIFSDNTEACEKIDNNSTTIKVGDLLRTWPVALLKGRVS